MGGISLLSADLRSQLHYNICSPWILRHPLWWACDNVDDRLIKRMCKLAFQCKSHQAGEILFEDNVNMEQSYVLMWGSMQYSIANVTEDDVGALSRGSIVLAPPS